ncbi:MAG: DUF5677 domain-containing protein [Bacilli bacterium]|jgi:hypothetical protein
MTTAPLTKERFHELIMAVKVPSLFDEGFLYELHQEALRGIDAFMEQQPNNLIRYINPVIVTLYCLHEHFYYAAGSDEATRKKLQDDDVYIARIIGAAVDKYLTNEHLEFRESAVKSRYFPPLTTLKMYVNTINGLLSGFQSKQPQDTLLTDIAKKCVSLEACAIDLLISGFETEAFSTWRTLHESEAILAILHQFKGPAVTAYLTHLQYGLAFHRLIEDVARSDQIFAKLKEEMKAHDLKSKDMKKFIEYGWLYPLVPSGESLRLNFRDGVQKLAGLSRYNRAYEMSSEITHSSPLLIYSKRTTFYDLALIYLYETFFRLERIFNEAFVPKLSATAQSQYQNLRKIYYPQLGQIHKIESEKIVAKKTVK